MHNNWLVHAFVGLSLALSLRVRAEDGALIPDAVKVPADYKTLCKMEAKGVQVYKGSEGPDGKLSWVFEEPIATLLADGKLAGWHFDGPSWVSTDGSLVKKRTDLKDAVAKAPAPNAANDIPWLRIAIKGDDAKVGVLSKAVFVQRINTKGGQPPLVPPSRVGIKVGVEYTATYVFFRPGIPPF
jgi:hypothetical protein